MRWEHTMRGFDNRSGIPDMMQVMNELGAEGWELVAVQPYQDAKGTPMFLIFLKRQIVD